MPADPLPARPDLDQLRRRAKELRDAARDSQAGREDGRQRSPLFCSAAQNNPGITRLLLERGARPDDDHMLYLAAFADGHECLRLLLPYAPDIAHTTALSAPLSTGDITGVRTLIEAGAATERIVLAPDDPKPPSPEVADLLRSYGIE